MSLSRTAYLGEGLGEVSEIDNLRIERDTLLRDLKNCHESKAKFGDMIITLQAERDQLKAENERLRNMVREANDALCTVQGLSWSKITDTERGKIKRAIAVLHGKEYPNKALREVDG